MPEDFSFIDNSFSFFLANYLEPLLLQDCFGLSSKINFFSAEYYIYDILETQFFPVVKCWIFFSNKKTMKCFLDKLKFEYIYILAAAKS